MVHVCPFETDPKKIRSTDDDDQGHNNMDHSAMSGMKMNLEKLHDLNSYTQAYSSFAYLHSQFYTETD
jgi:hypothetical protein